MRLDVALQPRLSANSPVRQAMRSLGEDRIAELALRAAERRELWRRAHAAGLIGPDSELERFRELERLADPVVRVGPED